MVWRSDIPSLSRGLKAHFALSLADALRKIWCDATYNSSNSRHSSRTISRWKRKFGALNRHSPDGRPNRLHFGQDRPERDAWGARNGALRDASCISGGMPQPVAVSGSNVLATWHTSAASVE